MPVGATHSFPHPSDPARRKAFRWREDSQGCTVSSVFCTEGVCAIQDLQGQEGVQIRAAKGTIQYKGYMQMQLMLSIAGFVVVIITNFRGL